jgi:E3 ubiquitin-protein ligase BRE1
MLLDNLGDSEFLAQNNECSEFLYYILSVGSNENCDSENNNSSNSSSNEVFNSLSKRNKRKSFVDIDQDQNDVDMIKQFEDNLKMHSSFTLTVLQRLCHAIIEATKINHEPEIINSFSESSDLFTERQLLIDQISFLSKEIVDLNIKLCTNENEYIKETRISDRNKSKQEQLLNISNDASELQNTTTTLVTTDLAGSNNSYNQNDAIIKDLKSNIITRENAIIEMENSKIKVELKLTERIARPLSQTEAQVNDLKHAYEELQQQCKQRVNTHFQENIELRNKVTSVENSILTIESSTEATVKEITTIAEKNIQATKSDINFIRSSLLDTQADLSMNSQLTHQVKELDIIDRQSHSDKLKLGKRVRVLNISHTLLKGHIDNTNLRIKLLEEKKNLLNNSNNCSIDEKFFIELSKNRTAEIQMEINNYKLYIDKLILEIEELSIKQQELHDQKDRINDDLNKSQVHQKNVFEKSLKLHDQIIDIQLLHAEKEDKLKNMKHVLQQNHSIILQNRQLETNLRHNTNNLKTQNSELQNIIYCDEEISKDCSDKAELIGQNLEEAKKRNKELNNRLSSLNFSIEKEKKLRLNIQKELLKNPKKSDATLLHNKTIIKNDPEILEKSLDLLKCSVCKDRFKSIAITRCFHLFCKECIDENLRNRHRKCPACGEKFGQDDVRDISFTN